MTEIHERTILLTDPTGTVGNEVLKRLPTSGQNIVRVAVAKDLEYDKLKDNRTIQIAHIDNSNRESISGALANVDSLFLRIPPSIDMLDISSLFVEEAKKNGIKLIVKLSAMGADLEPGYTSGRLHRKVEKIIEASGIPHIFLRPNSFMQNFLTRSSQTIKNENAIYLPAGDGKVSFVDARDVARVVVELLTKDESQQMNKVYEITGPESLSHMQIADILSEHIGKRISYVNISEEDARNRMKKMGIQDWYIDNALKLYDIYRSGYRAQTTDVVELLTGERPISFAEIARNYVQNGISWPNQSRVLTGWLKFE